jgi:hypothetical protein
VNKGFKNDIKSFRGPNVKLFRKNVKLQKNQKKGPRSPPYAQCASVSARSSLKTQILTRCLDPFILRELKFT